MKNIAVIFGILIALFFSSILNADDKSHKDEASKLLDAMEMSKLLSQTIDSALNLELQKNPSLLPYKQTMKDFFGIYMSAESLSDEFIELYVEAFTEKELKEMIVFYSSPTGKKSIELTPTLFEQGAQIGQKRVADNLEELEEMIQLETDRILQLQEDN